MAKILLVEDDKSLREIYGVRLMAEGYEIVSAGDGEEALAMAIKERPDLIVSDVMMPKISGFDMLDILRSTSETKDVKVIMMTALSSDDQRARGEALGADRYLVKSQVGIEDVVRTVHDVLGDSIGVAAATPAPATPVDTSAPVSAPADPAPAAFAQPFAPAPAPAPADPVVSAAPVAPTFVPEPVAPAPAPVFTPEPIAAPAAPVAIDPASPYGMPAAPAPAPFVSEPVAAPAPAFEQPIPAPAPFPPAPADPAPAAFAQPFAPAPAPAPAAAPTTLSELPPNPMPLPQPTAPFSSPAPASLGERVIEPLTNPAAAPGTVDIASQIEQALSDTNSPNQGIPPVPPTA